MEVKAEVEVQMEVAMDLMLRRKRLHKPHLQKELVRRLVTIPYRLSIQ